jgi:hypothetical protein
MAAPFRFFDNQPQKGRPLALKGIAAGLAKLARAVERIEIFGGRVDWHNGEPLLIPPEFNGYASELQNPQPFQMRVSGTELQAYLPTVATTTQGHLLYHRQPGAPRSPLAYNSDNGGWADTGLTLPTTGATVHVFAQVAVVASPTGADHTQAGFVDWTFATTGVEDGTDTKIGYGYIGSVTESGGAYIIRQHHTGQLRIDRDDGDARVNDLLGANAIRRQHTIERMSGNAGAFQLADVESLPDFTNVDNTNVVFIEDIDGVRYVRYRNWADFIDFIESDIDLGIPGIIDTRLGEYDPDDPSPLDHSALGDVVDQSVGDDHRGGRTGVTYGEEDEDLGHPYIHAVGDATRNAMPGVIGDGDGEESIDPSARTIKTAAGVTSLDASTQGAAIADLTPSTATAEDCATAINAILARLRAYKIIATDA